MAKEQRRKKSTIAFDEHEGEVHHDESNWLVSYADLMTLLMGFFILMYSMSITDDEKFNAVSKQVANYFGGPLVEDPRIKDAEAKVENVLKTNQLDQFAHVEQKNGKIYIKFANEILFKSGSPYLTIKAREAIQSVGEVLAKINGIEEIKVNGHTDSVPIKSKYYPSNWELSSARASTIVRHFNKQGVSGKLLRAIGHAGKNPLVPNKDKEGNYIKDNLRVNRRVEVEVKLARKTNVSKFKKKSLFSFLEEDKSAGGERKPTAAQLEKLSDADIEKKYQAAQAKLKETNKKLRKIQSLKKQEEKRQKMLKKIEELEQKNQKSSEELNELIQ